MNAVRKHFPELEETQKGHMQKEPSGIRSTKKWFNQKPTDEENKETNDPKHQNERYKKNKDIFVKVIDLQDEFQQQITSTKPENSRQHWAKETNT